MTEHSKSEEGDAMLDGQDVPRDAKVIATILKSMSVEEYEPRVIPQLLEFMYRYVFEVLQDSQLYADHAGKSAIDLSDVRLAIQSRVNYSFTQPPPRELLLALAQTKNSLALPQVPPKFGVQMPQEEYCLISANYQVDPGPKEQRNSSEPIPTTPATPSTSSNSGPYNNFKAKSSDLPISIQLDSNGPS